MNKSWLGWTTVILVIVGALNWGLVGTLDFNLVDALVGTIPWLERTVYILVGVAGILELAMLFKK